MSEQTTQTETAKQPRRLGRHAKTLFAGIGVLTTGFAALGIGLAAAGSGPDRWHDGHHDGRGGYHDGRCGGKGADFRGGPHAGPGGPMKLFDEVDANDDGQVTRAELDSFRSARFESADANGDGTIDLAEFQQVWLQMHRERMVDAFQHLDDDGDAAVTPEEMGGRLERMFTMMDRDGDDAVSLEELRGPGPKRR